MSTDSTNHLPLSDSLTFDILFAIFVTVLVYFDWWNGTIPPLPNESNLLLSLGGGTVIGGIVTLFNEKRESRDFNIRRSAIALTATILAGIVLGVVFFPRGLPVSIEIGLLTIVWVSVVGGAAIQIVSS